MFLKKYFLYIIFLVIICFIIMSCPTSDSISLFSRQVILKASDQADDSYFGCSVSLSGNYAIVGAYHADSGGQAYIFKRNKPDSWKEIGILTSSDRQDGDYFGWSVSISGDYAIVGAPHAIDLRRGSAYVFKNNGSDAWNEIQKLTPAVQEDDDEFGASVFVYGDHAIISGGGRAYIYKNNGAGDWDETAILTASDEDVNFSQTVCLYEDYAITGASHADSGGEQRGKAYIYTNDGSDNWIETSILTASDAIDYAHFGASVFIYGDYAIIGSPDNCAGMTDRGRAYIFKNDGIGWNEISVLTESHNDVFFGENVSLSGNFAVVGSYNACFNNEYGEVYIYIKDGSDNWVEIETPAVSEAGSYIGSDLLISDGLLIIGAKNAPSGGENRGQAYIFY